MNKPIKEFTEEELKRELITLDFHGKDFKVKVLKELLSREWQKGYLAGKYKE
jgi:hypothetical protein